MDQVTQANAAQTEELSSTAQALAEQATGLQALVGGFKVMDGIGAAAAADPPARATLPKARPRARPEPLQARVPARKPEPALAGAHAGNGAGHHEDEER